MKNESYTNTNNNNVGNHAEQKNTIYLYHVPNTININTKINPSNEIPGGSACYNIIFISCTIKYYKYYKKTTKQNVTFHPIK